MAEDDAEYAAIKNRAQELLTQGLPEADQTTLKSYIETTDARIKSIEHSEQLLEQITKKAAELSDRPMNRWIEAMQTPPFYFFFGLFLLVAAFFTSQFELNSSLTFLVAMLGVAVLLYGTGSQAAGTFGGDSGVAKALLDGKPADAVRSSNMTDGRRQYRYRGRCRGADRLLRMGRNQRVAANSPGVPRL